MPADSKLTPLEQEILTACRDRMAEIAGRPRPPKWQTWERADLDELRRYGPRYSPSEWFGGGRSLPEKYRVRYLRAINKLMAAGLLHGTTTEGNRLTFLRLTDAGAALVGTGGAAAKKKPKKKPTATFTGGTLPPPISEGGTESPSPAPTAEDAR